MPKEYLPLKVDPFRFADNATCLHGNLPIKNMERLRATLASDKGDVELTINFGVDEQGIRYMRGRISTHLDLQCQRCMESFDYGIISDFKLGIVESEEEAKKLPDYYDPLVVTEANLFIPDVVEDELIVNLPIVSMHEPRDCKVKLPLIAESDSISEIEKDNPFKVVELLRHKRNKE